MVFRSLLTPEQKLSLKEERHILGEMRGKGGFPLQGDDKSEYEREGRPQVKLISN